MRGTLAERLAAKQLRDPVTGCLLFTGCRTKKGYGMLFAGDYNHPAHRVAAFLAGIIPSLDDPHMVCHHCDTPPCTEPDHLYKGDAISNKQDALSRGRWVSHNKDKQICKRGHPLTENNVSFMRNGERRCRTCHRMHRQIAQANREGRSI